MVDKDESVSVTVAGFPGRVSFDGFGYALHGKWASHTGYRHEITNELSYHAPELDLETVAQRLATQAYDINVTYPFVVGEEHREQGWKSIRVNYEGLVQIRLPDWHEGVVADVLVRMGMKLDCDINHFWVFDASVDLKIAKEVLAPILKAKTRLTDEHALAKALEISARQAGLIDSIEQLSLF